MSDFVKKSICEGVTFSYVNDGRFKRGRQSATLIVPLSKETASANALLSCILTRSCRKYPTFKELNRKLNSMYGAALYPSIRRIGDYQCLTVASSGIEDRYALNDEKISAQLAELICSMLFEPNLVGGHFPDEDVEQERRQLIETIDSEMNDNRLYAIKRCVNVMCAEERYSIGKYGSREGVGAVGHKDLTDALEKLLREAQVELTFLGGSDPEYAYEGFSRYFAERPRKPQKVSPQIVSPSEVRRITETRDISQSKLVLGFRCDYSEEDKMTVENLVLSKILGGMPTSKLFMNVREKQSLCYYCASVIDTNKGIMLIDSGVETENLEKTEKAILEQVDMLKRGNISDSELEDAKLSAKNSFLTILDGLAAMQTDYIGSILKKDPLSPSEAAKAVEGVTKERVIEIAQKIELDTVFSLVGN